MINEINIGVKCFIPIFKGKRGLSKKGKAMFDNLSVFMFSKSILFKSIRT